MLQRLLIQNYALIKELEINPSNDLNIITGETGAGKSIMLGAIGLLLGERADYKALFDQDKKCIVEAEFSIEKLNLKKVFESEDIDYEEPTIIRREINSNGKSRAFINDTPCRLEQLKTIGRKLIDIHSQHQTIFLNKSNFQFQLIDGLAQSEKELTTYQLSFDKYSQLLKTKKELLQKAAEQSTDVDYKKFILNELEEARLEDLDIEELEQKSSIIENTEVIKENIQLALSTIAGEEEYASINSLFNAHAALKQIENLNTDYEKISTRFHSLIEELKDLSSELEGEQNRLEYNPEEAVLLKNQLDGYYHLTNKHQAQGIEELIKLRDSTQIELNELANFDETLENLEVEIQEALEELTQKGSTLSTKRNNTARSVELKVQELLSEVGINEGIFKMELTPLDNPTKSGLDSIQFLFSANKGIKPESIEKVA